MLIGAHAILYSTNAQADREFLRDVLGLPHVDAGSGWLIFGLPPTEVAVHPSEAEEKHELYFMCADVAAFVATMGGLGIACSPVHDEGWGLLTHITLPGGGRVGVYQPRHARPQAASVPGKSKRKGGAAKRRSAKASKAKPAKRFAKKSAAKKRKRR